MNTARDAIEVGWKDVVRSGWEKQEEEEEEEDEPTTLRDNAVRMTFIVLIEVVDRRSVRRDV